MSPAMTHLLSLTALAACSVCRVLASLQCQDSLTGEVLARGQSCFEFNPQSVTWIDAQHTCQERSGRLATISSLDLQTWTASVASTVWPNQDTFWIGLNERAVDNLFVWDDYNDTAHSGTYYNWFNTRRDRFVLYGCVYMQKSQAWRWRVADCAVSANRKFFVCEYRAWSWTTAVSSAATFPNEATTWPTETAVQVPRNQTAIDMAEPTEQKWRQQQGLVVPLAVGFGCTFVLATIAGLLVYVCHRKRQSKDHTGGIIMSTDAATAIGNPIYYAKDGAVDLYGQVAVCSPKDEPTSYERRPTSSVYTDMNAALRESLAELPSAADSAVSPIYAVPFELQLSSSELELQRQQQQRRRPSLSVQGSSCAENAYVEAEPLLEPGSSLAHTYHYATGSSDGDPRAATERWAADANDAYASVWTAYENVPGTSA